MTEAKVYFGCLPKEEIPKFFDGLKKALDEGAGDKTNDEKKFTLEVRGTKEEPKGVSFETFSLNDSTYGTFFDDSAHLQEALSVLSFSVGAKDEGSVKVLSDLFEKMKPLFEELPFVKAKPGKYKVNLRTKGTKVSVDFSSVEGEFFKPYLDLGLNLSDFHNFTASLKSQFSPGDFFNLPVEELSLKFLQLVLSVSGSTKNAKYLLNALIKALKEIKLTNEKFQAKKEKHVDKLKVLNSFVGAEFSFEFDAKELCGTGMEAVKQCCGGVDLNQGFGQFKTMLEGLFTTVVKPTLEAQNLIEAVKATDIDEFSISFGIPKYKNGLAQVVKIPGFTKAFSDKFLA